MRSRVLNPYKKLPKLSYGKFYLQGNYVEGSKEVTDNNWLGVVMNEGTDADIPLSKVTVAFPAEPLHIQTAPRLCFGFTAGRCMFAGKGYIGSANCAGSKNRQGQFD